MLKKKSLGQHFLNSAHYLNAVADAAEVTKGDTVLEIGPGEGALTKVLLERGATVVAVEKDARLMPVLNEKFGKKVRVIEADALDIDLAKLKLKKFKVVGNIPYYITGALLRTFLSEKKQPSLLVFLMQKEVAERIARSKKESILSLSVKAYGEPKYVKTVPKGAFVPPPKVDSAILKVSDISRAHFATAAHEERFFQLVKAGFGQKRKRVASNLKALVGERAAALGDVRAEDLPLESWLMLAR